VAQAVILSYLLYLQLDTPILPSLG